MRAVRLGCVELRCPQLDASRDFFVDVLGLIETHRENDASYLRCFGERAHHSVVLRRSECAGLALLGWRASPAGVEPRANGGDSVSGGPRVGRGPALALASPDGHRLEAFSEVEPAPRLPARMLNQSAPLRGWGVEPRRLSHAAVVVEDPEASARWWRAELDLAERERVCDEDGALVVSLGASPQPADLIVVRGRPSTPGALHHVAFAIDHRDELVRAADILAERRARIESGIGQHGLGQLAFLYFFEPSGNRVALVSSPMLVLDDWEPVRWEADDAERGLHWWGAPIPETYFTVHT